MTLYIDTHIYYHDSEYITWQDYKTNYPWNLLSVKINISNLYIFWSDLNK